MHTRFQPSDHAWKWPSKRHLGAIPRRVSIPGLGNGSRRTPQIPRMVRQTRFSWSSESSFAAEIGILKIVILVDSLRATLQRRGTNGRSMFVALFCYFLMINKPVEAIRLSLRTRLALIARALSKIFQNSDVLQCASTVYHQPKFGLTRGVDP